MAHHASAKKRIRQDSVKRISNRYYKKSTRTAIRKLREMEDKTEAVQYLPKVISMIDRLSKSGNWHANKAGNLKSSLTKLVNAL
jgi:small subunit ribosomal protein S20